jgi:hypothetical protein
MSRRVEPRKATFKKTTDVEESRRRREETANAIRKEKRDENLQKKRFVGGSPAGPERRIDPTIAQKVSPLVVCFSLYTAPKHIL